MSWILHDYTQSDHVFLVLLISVVYQLINGLLHLIELKGSLPSLQKPYLTWLHDKPFTDVARSVFVISRRVSDVSIIFLFDNRRCDWEGGGRVGGRPQFLLAEHFNCCAAGHSVMATQTSNHINAFFISFICHPMFFVRRVFHKLLLCLLLDFSVFFTF